MKSDRYITVNELAEMFGLDGSVKKTRDLFYSGGLGTECLQKVRFGRLSRWVRVQVLEHLRIQEQAADGRCDGSCREALAEEKPRMYAVR